MAQYLKEEEINRILSQYDNFFVTSDTWFGRLSILEIANRKFEDLNEMNNKFIKNWNSVVKQGDLVFHLGNFAWDPLTCKNVLKKLNGKIIFLKGNADAALLENDKALVSSESILLLSKFDTVLCHYPMKDWPGKNSGTIHFHGHETYNNDTNLVKGCNVVNVCTDFWDYKPIKYTDIKKIIEYKN